MNHDERLIPFLGGLVIGGVGGAAAEGNKMNYNNGYGYYQPYYNGYPYQVYNNYYPYAYNQQPLPTNSMQYPQYNNMPYNQYQFYSDPAPSTKVLDESPVPIVITTDTRNTNDISYVPKYIP